VPTHPRALKRLGRKWRPDALSCTVRETVASGQSMRMCYSFGMRPSIRSFRPGDRDALIALWQACELTRPWNDPGRDIDRKLAVDPENLLVLDSDGDVVGSVMVGYEGHRGWISYLAVHPTHQRQGLARQLMDEAERRLRNLGCSKTNLQVRNGNASALAFYARIGFAADDVVSLGKRLLIDDT
jgi:ribosomal protein S18 acetylase RimI-like enzyme